MEVRKPRVSATPHIRAKENVSDIMMDVIIALAPAAVMGAFYFGIRAVAHMVIAVVSALAFEYIFELITRRPKTVKDFSAVVTGLLLAFNIPATAPFWIPVVGSMFAIVIVKQLFGGLGQNFMNPALGARAFLLAAYPVVMTNWAFSNNVVDGVTSATPLEMLKNGFVPQTSDLSSAFLGNISGCIGETCSAALLLGFAYLLVRRIISWRIPVTFMATFGVLVWILGRNGTFTGNPFYELCTGGIMLGAIFMATDYSSSPVTPLGQIIMGIGCGLLTALIRINGSYPEGVSYSILLMNLAVPLIDKLVKPRVYGEVV